MLFQKMCLISLMPIDIPLLNSLHVDLSKRHNLMGIIYLLVVFPPTILYSSVAWLIENMGG
jgi:hypothetical protein